MKIRITRIVALVLALSAVAVFALTPTTATGLGDQISSRQFDDGQTSSNSSSDNSSLDQRLAAILRSHGFSGRIESTLERRLGRPINQRRANLGRLLWFDTITGLNDDNTCGGCHSPTTGFGDTQSIAIGIDNNFIVGPHRQGPRNQRRAPTILNTAFFPNLMWNSRFASLSGDPFDNSLGFQFPPPEGLSLSFARHLLVAQAFIPPTERIEVAGFAFPGDNDAIRAEVLRRLNQIQTYRELFGELFPEVRYGGPITFEMFGKVIAEFEFTLTFAKAPIDQFARGDRDEMTRSQKTGALLFFGKAGCVRCHSVSGESNEMFSDFSPHVIGVPQIAPSVANIVFDGPGANEDFGLEQVTGDPNDRYKFRTSPLRNVALQPTFFHNGAYTRLEDAIRFHLNVAESARTYNPVLARVAIDLQGPTGPIEPVLARLDPLMRTPVRLTSEEFRELVDFVRNGLLDSRARPENLRRLIPNRVPSGRPVLIFER
jgi:cytochrome c peroxidase